MFGPVLNKNFAFDGLKDPDWRQRLVRDISGSQKARLVKDIPGTTYLAGSQESIWCQLISYSDIIGREISGENIHWLTVISSEHLWDHVCETQNFQMNPG